MTDGFWVASGLYPYPEDTALILLILPILSEIGSRIAPSPAAVWTPEITGVVV